MLDAQWCGCVFYLFYYHIILHNESNSRDYQQRLISMANASKSTHGLRLITLERAITGGFEAIRRRKGSGVIGQLNIYIKIVILCSPGEANCNFVRPSWSAPQLRYLSANVALWTLSVHSSSVFKQYAICSRSLDSHPLLCMRRSRICRNFHDIDIQTNQTWYALTIWRK